MRAKDPEKSMRTVNTSRRAVAIGIVGFMAICTTAVGFDAARLVLSPKWVRTEEVLRQMEEYRKDGARAFLDSGRVTVFGGWTRENETLKADLSNLRVETYEQAYERLAKEKRMFLKEQSRLEETRRERYKLKLDSTAGKQLGCGPGERGRVIRVCHTDGGKEVWLRAMCAAPEDGPGVWVDIGDKP